MDGRTRITLEELTRVYTAMGLLPLEGTPFVFVRHADDLMMFHQPISHDNPIEFDWRIVAWDIEKTETLLGAHGLVDEFIGLLARLFLDHNIPD